MSIKIPCPVQSDFRVGECTFGKVVNVANFGLIIELNYSANGRSWGQDGILHILQTPHREAVQSCQPDQLIEVVVIRWEINHYRLQVALPADPTWLTTDVLGLARAIRNEQAFDRMPILADALEEAGCADRTVLEYCRADKAIRDDWLLPLLAPRQFLLGKDFQEHGS